MPLSRINKLLKLPSRASRWTEMCNFVRPRMPENSFERPIFEGTVRRTTDKLKLDDYTQHGFVRGRIRSSRIHPEDYEFVVSDKIAASLVEPFGYSSALHELVLKDWGGVEQKRLQVIPQAVDRHPVTDRVTGLDFCVYDADDTMRILFPVMFERHLYAYGVQMNRGIFQIENDRVWCHWKGSADKLPRFFRINCEQLDVGEKVHWEDVAKPKGLTLIDDNEPHVFCKIKSASEVEDMMKEDDGVEPDAAAAATAAAGAAPSGKSPNGK